MSDSAPSSGADVARGVRVDPRVARSQQRLIAAAVELLCEHGAAGLTIEGVAARSGVAKTTIYRHFADRDAIHIAAAEALGTPIEVHVTGQVVDDVRAALVALAARLRDGQFAAVLATCIDAAERSERMADLTVASCQARRGWLLGRLRLAVEQGELDPRTDVDLLVSQLAGPLFFRRLVSRQPVDDGLVDAIVATVLVPLVDQTESRVRSGDHRSGDHRSGG